MRLEKNIVVAGGLAGIGWAAARISPAKRSSWTVAARLVKATEK
jgi:NAD(P)-dependent dehydrogenase (short-subunit alcohol dehydrogenase family)